MARKAKRGPAPGSQVEDENMRRAARAWIELEDSGKLSNSAVGRAVGLKRAPDWLQSDKFKQVLETERFNAELSRVQGLKGASAIVDQILNLGFSEMFRRLTFTPGEIPAPQLFGDLTRMLKMRAELEQQEKGGQQAPASLMITIRQEIMRIPDPRLQESVLRKIFGDYQRALATVKDLLPAGATTDVVDVVGVSVDVPGDRGTLALPAPASADGGDRPATDTQVWTDPVEQVT